MKYYKLSALVLVLFVFHGRAQVSFGPRIGMNVSKYNHTVTLDSSKTKVNINLHIGASVDIWLAEKMALQTGLFYTAGGQEYSMDINPFYNYTNTIDTAISKISGTFTAAAIKLPLLFTFDSDGKPGMGNDDGMFDGFRAEAGIYAAYKLNTTVDQKTEYKVIAYDSTGAHTETNTFSETKKEKTDMEKSHINKLDVGIQFGVGIEKSVGLGTLLININFNFGLLDLYKLNASQQPNGYKPVLYRDWGISLTYFFPSF